MNISKPILVTGAAGSLGAVGRTITELLLKQNMQVRAMVRTEDQRAQALRDMGAEVVVGDLLDLDSMHRAIAGCEAMYFGMSVSDTYLAATVNAAVVAKHYGVKAFVNMSQLTLSQMSITESTASPQHKLHWLAEQALNWSGLPVIHVRPTVYMQHFFFLAWAAESIVRDGTIRLPFGLARTSPVDTRNVAEVIATILISPADHIGKIYELTGPQSLDMHSLAAEYAAALQRPVEYIDIPFEQWRDQLRGHNLPEHVSHHFLTMAELHASNRYDRLTHDIEKITGKPATSVRDFVVRHTDLFETNRGT